MGLRPCDTSEFFDNLIAEVVARFIIGVVIGGFVTIWMLPDIAFFWKDAGWTPLLIPLGAGFLAALMGVRRGPGII